EWLLVERERLRRLALDVLGQLAETSLQQGDFAPGIKAARRLLSIEPWYEAGHCQLMKLLAADGQRSAALAQYETCRQRLADELDVAPSAETMALVDAIRTGAWQPPQAIRVELGAPTSIVEPAALPPHNLLAATTSFVDRRAEQAKITELLTEVDCRLLTITGTGGMGKTRLAAQIAAHYLEPDTPFRDGIYFVPLKGVNPTSGAGQADVIPFISAIGAAIGVSFSGKAPLEIQLLNAVRKKLMLLVLDNFEHLADYSGQVVAMLEQAPGLKVIVTSRTRLNLYDECVFDLWGLPYPSDDSVPLDLELYESLQLFEQRARRVRHDFDVQAELPDVVRICRLLAGMPLALELAAAWVRTLSCRDIAQEIEQNLDFLATKAQNVPERQRSIRAVFDYSWRSLTAGEQDALKKMSVFAGGFSLAAARQVAEATPQTLADLVDRSLVRQETSGRYELHELLRQYALDKLRDDPTAYEVTMDHHCVYFADYAMQRNFETERDHKKSLIDRDIEIDNIRLAWAWAIEQGRVQGLFKLHLGLGELYEIAGRYEEGLELFQRASVKLYEIYQERKSTFSTGYHEIGEIYGQMLAWQAWFTLRLGRYKPAQTLLFEALSISEQSDSDGQWQRAYPLYQLGLIDWYLGRYTSARQYLEEAAAVARQTNGLFIIMACSVHLGLTETNLGHFQAARQHYEEGMMISERIGMHSVTGGLYNFLGRMAYFQSDYDQAEQHLEQGVDMCRAAEHHFHVAFGLTYQGLVRAWRGQPDQGQRLCLESLDIFNDIGEPYGQALALDHLGQVTWLAGNYEQSKRYFLKTLQTSLEIGTMPQTLSAMVGLAQHLTRTGHTEQAAQLLAYAIRHPAGGHNTGQSARRRLVEMGFQSEAEPSGSAPSDEQIETAARALVVSQYKTL
ncbi:MAG: tetratricopeptide repeat protein, partial [Anaerolineae bacterium]|nr:tetratricopeptide repeat protein [Anaerolineae bacterium]